MIRNSPNVVKTFRCKAAIGTTNGHLYIYRMNDAARPGGGYRGESHLEPAFRGLIDLESSSFKRVHLFGTIVCKAFSLSLFH